MPAIVPRPATSTRAVLAFLDGGEPRLDHLGVELHLAVGDDAEHRLGRARREAADARHAPADDAVGRRHHLDAPAPPHQLAALRLDLRLLGFGDLEAVLGGHQLRFGGARGLLALVVDRLGHVAGLRSGLARSKALRLSTTRASACTIELLGLGDGRRGAREAGIVLGDLGVQRIGHQLGQHIALLHALAFVGQHLGDAQALDLGADQDLLARHQRAGGEHRLGEVGGRDAHDRNRRGELLFACALAAGCGSAVGCGDERHGQQTARSAATTQPMSSFLITM